MLTNPGQHFDFLAEPIDLAALRIEAERIVLLSLDLLVYRIPVPVVES
jgi:hypothetical protein